MKQVSGFTAVVGLLLIGGAAVYGLANQDNSPAPAPTAQGTVAPAAKPGSNRPTSQPGTPVVTKALFGDCKVTRVVDGDTFHALCADVDTMVRVIGIDTPETVAPGKPVGCFGPEASDRAKDMLEGHSVRLYGDPTQDTLDRYGRRLAYVQVGGRDFGMEMIRAGYAREYSYNKRYLNRAQYIKAGRVAGALQLGLWGVCQEQQG
jgi:micrococcal nuclease